MLTAMQSFRCAMKNLSALITCWNCRATWRQQTARESGHPVHRLLWRVLLRNYRNARGPVPVGFRGHFIYQSFPWSVPLPVPVIADQMHWPYMPALVTGASGFLGGRLAQVLVSRGEQVTVLARAGADLRHLDGLPLRIVAGTLSDVAALAEAVRDVTHIYHCAACSCDWAPWRTFHEANVTGVRNLLAAAATVPTLRRFLHVSTTDIYGYPRVLCDESHPVTDIGLPYNSTKVAGENCVRQAGLSGLPITIVRPATIYGPRGKEFAVNIAKHIRTRTMAVIDGGRSTGGSPMLTTSWMRSSVRFFPRPRSTGHIRSSTEPERAGKLMSRRSPTGCESTARGSIYPPLRPGRSRGPWKP
jgi:uncharacterized protein YbjT (DUF2867 family)